MYAHLPLIVGADRRQALEAPRRGRGRGLPRRGLPPRGAASTTSRCSAGRPADGREILDADELVAEFDLDRVTHSAAVFDHKKLDWMNGEWIRRARRSTSSSSGVRADRARALRRPRRRRDACRGAPRIGQERAATLVALVDQMDFLFVADDEFAIDAEAWDKVVATTERVGEVLDAVIAHVETCEWTVDAIDLRAAIEALGIEAAQGDARCSTPRSRAAPRACRCSTR